LATPKFTQHQQDSKYPAVAMGNLKAKASKASRKDFGSASKSIELALCPFEQHEFSSGFQTPLLGSKCQAPGSLEELLPKETLDKDFEKARPSRTLLGVFFCILSW